MAKRILKRKSLNCLFSLVSLLLAVFVTATAQQMPVPGEGEVPAAVTIEPELSLGELTRVVDAGSWIRQESGLTRGAQRSPCA